MEATSPSDTARYWCCHCRAFREDTCDLSDAPKIPIQQDDSTRKLSESTHPTFSSLNLTLSRTSSTAEEESRQNHSNRLEDNAVNSSASEGYKQDTSLNMVEAGAEPARATRFPQISPETRRFLLFILMGLLFIPFSFAVRLWGNLDSSQTVGVLQVSVIFFVELAKMFPWI